MNYKTPEESLSSFTCPHCGTITQQTWCSVDWNGYQASPFGGDVPIKLSTCTHCKDHTLWIGGKMYYPDTGNAPYPNAEMPESVKELYLEASSIYSKSPRGASALLRLGIQILCKELGENGKNINNDIANLVKKGLPEMIQQSLDAVRVIGNEAVHPGQIDTDDPGIAMDLFKLLNIIVEYMIAMPNKVSGLYGSLPKKKLEAIDERDSKS